MRPEVKSKEVKRDREELMRGEHEYFKKCAQTCHSDILYQLFSILCVQVVLSVSINHMHAWCLQSPEEGVISTALDLQMIVAAMWML